MNHNEIGLALERQGEPEAALEEYMLDARETRQIAAYTNASSIHYKAGRYEKALEVINEGLQFLPDEPALHFDRSLNLLALEQWDEGWKEYEWRKPAFKVYFKNLANAWDGSPQPDKRLMVFSEQGIGDGLMFSRYVPLAAQRVGQLLFAPRIELVALMRRALGEMVAHPQEPHDIACHLADLPRLLACDIPPPLTLDLPADQVDFIAAENRKLPGRKIGICWQGRPRFSPDLYRSMRDADILTLGDVPDVMWCNLVLGRSDNQLPFPMLNAMQDKGKDLVETACIIATLDAVVTVDTAIGHLAGTLGKPTTILVPSNYACWRWGRRQSDTPWYPTARLFRQKAGEPWRETIQRLIQTGGIP